MLFSSLSRHCFCSITYKPLDSSFTKLVLFTTSSSSAEKFLTSLQENRPNIERALNTVQAKLDPTCIGEVLKRCAVNEPEMGLRFFIWSGLHPTYRHSSYMYSKTCKLLELEKNSRVICDVISAYRAENTVVSVRMFKVVLNLCRAAKDEKLGLWVLRKMKEFNCRPDTVAYNVVIRLVVEKGELDEAMGLMKEMGLIDLYPDMITYVSMIKGFCDVGRLEDACQLIKSMKGHGCMPNAVVYSALLDGVCKHGSLEKALEFLGEMEKEDEDCRPNVVTYSSVIMGFTEKGRVLEAFGILDRMKNLGLQPNRVTIMALIDGLCKEGHVEEACKFIDQVSRASEQHGAFYSLLVVSLCRFGKIKEAEKIFRMMMSSVMKPNVSALSYIIKGIISEGRALDGFSLFNSLEKSGEIPATDSEIYSILLSGLCGNSHLVEAAKLANLMVERRIQLKSPYVQDIVKYLKSSGEDDLASHIGGIES